MSDPITFSVRTKPVTYGDDATFHEYQILMRLGGRVVGSEEAPQRIPRIHGSQADACAAGRERIQQLCGHQLYAIDVTKKDIATGEGHSCEACAIAQALYRNQDRMGFPKSSHAFNVAPYTGMFSTAYGIALIERHPRKELVTTARGMPDLVFPSKRTGFAVESMMEWAMTFDDWADSRVMTLADWREEHGYRDGETPCKPWPVSFVLNVTEMKPAEIR